MATSFWVPSAWSADLDQRADVFDLSSGSYAKSFLNPIADLPRHTDIFDISLGIYAKPLLEEIHTIAHSIMGPGRTGTLMTWFREHFRNSEFLTISNYNQNIFKIINPYCLGYVVGSIHLYYEKMQYAYREDLSPPEYMFSNDFREKLIKAVKHSTRRKKNKSEKIVSDFLDPIERIIEEIGEDHNLFIFMLTGLASLKCQTREQKQSFSAGIKAVLEKDPGQR